MMPYIYKINYLCRQEQTPMDFKPITAENKKNSDVPYRAPLYCEDPFSC